MTRPLFIPLKREYYEQFRDGIKAPGILIGMGPPIPYQTEFRKHGPRWNKHTCKPGRDVVLSLGYGKKHRMQGVIVGFETSHEATKTKDWQRCYGNEPAIAACIAIHVL